jgi:hypothetical protein
MWLITSLSHAIRLPLSICRFWELGLLVHHLDSDGNDVACEPTPVPGDELAALFVW